MVEKNQIDPELLPALEFVMDFDIWADLDKTRAAHRALAEQYKAHESITDQVLYEDHQVPATDYVPAVRVRVYRPANSTDALPAMLWIHGGGFVMGTIDVEVPMMQRMVEEVGCIIVAVEYRLAPEHPHPAPLSDCYQALAWTFENATELGIDANRVAVGGISAGGGLAASLAWVWNDKNPQPILFQLLMCPMLDDRNQQPSTHFNLTGIGWDRRNNEKGWQALLGGDYQPDIHPHAVPARFEDLSGSPPAYISVGALDLFLDEDMAYARRLLAAGVPTELHVFPGGIHAFEYRVPNARLSQRAHYLNYEVLKHAFG